MPTRSAYPSPQPCAYPGSTAGRKSLPPARHYVRMASYPRAGVRCLAAQPDPQMRVETPEIALQRRMRESERVEERVVNIYSLRHFEQIIQEAGSKLVVVEIESDDVCELGTGEEPEYHWEEDRLAALAPCKKLKHVFQRCSRDCPDAMFLSVMDDGSEQVNQLIDHLGVRTFPSMLFYRHGSLVWQVNGVNTATTDLGEGVMYYGDIAGKGEVPSQVVQDIRDREQLEAFINGQPETMLTVLDVSTTNCNPCVHIYPAVVALARNFKGFASFGRFMGDSSDSCMQAMRELNVLEVPTFIFFGNGNEVLRHVGSSRGDLIGKILEVQAAAGIRPPPPPPRRSR